MHAGEKHDQMMVYMDYGFICLIKWEVVGKQMETWIMDIPLSLTFFTLFAL
jgi:hypothetical protein